MHAEMSENQSNDWRSGLGHFLEPTSFMVRHARLVTRMHPSQVCMAAYPVSSPTLQRNGDMWIEDSLMVDGRDSIVARDRKRAPALTESLGKLGRKKGLRSYLPTWLLLTGFSHRIFMVAP